MFERMNDETLNIFTCEEIINNLGYGEDEIVEMMSKKENGNTSINTTNDEGTQKDLSETHIFIDGEWVPKTDAEILLDKYFMRWLRESIKKIKDK